MNLKCIGGEHDGETYNSINLKVGDLFRIPDRSHITSIFTPFITVPEVTKISYSVYRICVFNFSKDDCYYFLAPVDWSDKQAILFQFNK